MPLEDRTAEFRFEKNGKAGKKVSASSLGISINNELFQALCETLSCGSQSFDLITYRMKRLFAERVKENV